MQKTIFINYTVNNVLQNAYSVQLASQDGTFGIKDNDNNVIVASGTSVDNPSVGLYQKVINLQSDTVYIVSWEIYATQNSAPVYETQILGPFSNQSGPRAVADYRGSFLQSARSTFFVRITTFDGNPVDPTSITCTITDPSLNLVTNLIPEKASSGFYAADWDIPYDQTPGDYLATWNYVINGNNNSEVQKFVVVPVMQTNSPSLYQGRVLEFRQSLEFMITCAQNIPVYSEPAKVSADRQTYMFSFSRWNQTPGCRIYVNDEIITSGLTIDYFNGHIIFDSPLTRYDRVRADYNFRWFSDEELDRFLSNAVNLVNLWPPVQRGVGLQNIADQYIPLVLYGAAVDAIRHMMMCLNFQQPQMVFGGPDGASKAYANLEGLKKNYEETWSKGLEQKKNGSYAGLTRTIVTPEFGLLLNRSRFFAYMFSNQYG